MLIESIIFETIRTKAMDEAEILTLLTQGMDAFQNNPNMGDHEKFGNQYSPSAIDMIKRAKDAGTINSDVAYIVVNKYQITKRTLF